MRRSSIRFSEPRAASPPGIAAPFLDCSDVLACPATGAPLALGASELTSGDRRYPIEEGIPRLFVPNDPSALQGDVTDLVKAFYEETPFPNYDDLDSRESLAEKAMRGVFGAALDRQLPDGAVILEAGCGTGQLTNFLGLGWNRRVFGGDICLNSLRLAESFRSRFHIANAAFLQMNLFRPPFRDGSLDVVISNGVLHHTGDAKRGFEALLRKLRAGGLILIGLYNRFGRLPTLWRRRAFERYGDSVQFLDARLARGDLNSGRRSAWFRDQYQHPHETRHSVDEVLRWFDEAGVEFLSSIPSHDGADFTADTQLFEPRARGMASIRIATQLRMLLTGGQDGGLFIMIGRKRR